MSRNFEGIREYMLSYLCAVGLGKITGLPAGWAWGSQILGLGDTLEKRHETYVNLYKLGENNITNEQKERMEIEN